MTQLKALQLTKGIILGCCTFLNHHRRRVDLHSYLEQVRKSERKLSPSRRQAAQLGRRSVNPSSHRSHTGYIPKGFLLDFVICNLSGRERFFLCFDQQQVLESKGPNQMPSSVLTHDHYARRTTGEGGGVFERLEAFSPQRLLKRRASCIMKFV